MCSHLLREQWICNASRVFALIATCGVLLCRAHYMYTCCAMLYIGARHGADIVATKLGVNNDISQGKINGVYSNVFAALGLSSSDDESLSSSEEEVAPQPRPPPPATKKAAGAGEGKGAKKKKNKGRGARKGSGRN